MLMSSKHTVNNNAVFIVTTITRLSFHPEAWRAFTCIAAILVSNDDDKSLASSGAI